MSHAVPVTRVRSCRAVVWGAAYLLGETHVGNATPFSICLPLKLLAHSLQHRMVRTDGPTRAGVPEVSRALLAQTAWLMAS